MLELLYLILTPLLITIVVDGSIFKQIFKTATLDENAR